jgi:uncharacterized protein (DUF1330 family)
MPAYLIAQITVRDAATYDRYRELAPPSIAQYGGRYVARGGTTETLEGTWRPKRLVILEFPSVEQARAWWASPEYAPAKALRQSSADADILVVEGLTREASAALAVAGHGAGAR